MALNEGQFCYGWRKDVKRQVGVFFSRIVLRVSWIDHVRDIRYFDKNTNSKEITKSHRKEKDLELLAHIMRKNAWRIYYSEVILKVIGRGQRKDKPTWQVLAQCGGKGTIIAESNKRQKRAMIARERERIFCDFEV